MKKIILFVVIFVFASFQMWAQPTITSAYNPTSGDVQVYHPCDTGTGPGATGANVTWDLTNMPITWNPITRTFFSPASTPYGTAYTTATVAYEDLYVPGTFTYYNGSSTKLENLGAASVLGTMVLADPMTMLTYPFTYMSTSNDAYNGTATSSGATLNVGGNYNVSATAWGTLKLPSGTYSNVLRLTIDHDYYTEYVGVQTYSYDITEYHFVSPSYDLALLQIISQDTYLDSVFFGHSKVVYVADQVSGVADPTLAIQNMKLWPNPAQNELNISYKLDDATTAKLEIFNVLGELVYSEDVNNTLVGENNIKVDVSHLEYGTYMTRLTTEFGSKTMNFIKIN